MKLYHVSGFHKDKSSIDFSISAKPTRDPMLEQVPQARSIRLLRDVYNNSELLSATGWKPYKIVAELIFEYIRKNEYPDSPSRLVYPFFSKNLDDAILFNREYRNGEGGIFICEADAAKVHYYDMDLFTEVSDAVRDNGDAPLTEALYIHAQNNAREYWETSKDGTMEILYEGFPTATNIEEINTKTITPGVGIGNYRIGMTQDEVEAQLDSEHLHFDQSELRWDIADGFFAFSEKKGTLQEIGVTGAKAGRFHSVGVGTTVRQAQNALGAYTVRYDGLDVLLYPKAYPGLAFELAENDSDDDAGSFYSEQTQISWFFVYDADAPEQELYHGDIVGESDSE